MGKADSNRESSFSSLAEQWDRFFERLDYYNARLIAELESCWRDQQAIIKGQLHRLDVILPGSLTQPDLHTFRTARDEAGQKLLIEPISQWERKRPYKRALMSIENYDRSLEELARALPEVVSISGPQAVDLLGKWGATGRRRLALFRRKESLLPLRAIVIDELQRLSLLRLKIEGRYLLALALAVRQLSKPWEMVRAAVDASVQGRPLPGGQLEAQREELSCSTELLANQIETAIAEWEQWNSEMKGRLAERVLAKIAWRRQRRAPGANDKRADHLTHRVEQMRAVEADVRLELALENSEDRILKAFHHGLESLILEQSNLLAELDSVIDWLRKRAGQNGQGDFPPPKADIAPASSRLSELDALFKAELGPLPQPCETLIKLCALPRRRRKWQKLYPREIVYQAFARTGRPQIALALEQVEGEHRKIVQEIERARQVVAFGLEMVSSEQDPHPELAREAIENALSSLEFYRSQSLDWSASADARMAKALADVFVESRLILRRHWLGVLAYLAEQGLRRTIALIGQAAASALGKALRSLIKTVEKLATRFLVYIGWMRPPVIGKLEVVNRPFLPQEFTIDLTAKDMPALYRHLFRFEPIQDPRFLVGREREMTAIAEARALWEASRSVAILIVGERGSGKTSLINCALKRSLEGLEVIRSEFSNRLVTESQLRCFLAELIGVDDPARLESFLSERRRIIILEELERTFLRQVGYYRAIRALQRLIAATGSSTLWILSVNQVAFRFLNAGVNLSQFFSHRINAGTASRDDLRNAILLRHNLSGLRLHFSPPPSQGGPANQLKRLIQGQADPEAIFFDALAQESAGVYRTAFDIWLGYIEAFQAGVLYMKPLATPNLSPVIDDLDLSDLFTLVAILQHGSLTAEEHGMVFQRSVAASRSQIDELLAREIIESDPGRPGYRVRPQAMRVVKEALYRRNLL